MKSGVMWTWRDQIQTHFCVTGAWSEPRWAEAAGGQETHLYTPRWDSPHTGPAAAGPRHWSNQNPARAKATKQNMGDLVVVVVDSFLALHMNKVIKISYKPHRSQVSSAERDEKDKQRSFWIHFTILLFIAALNPLLNRTTSVGLKKIFLFLLNLPTAEMQFSNMLSFTALTETFTFSRVKPISVANSTPEG